MARRLMSRRGGSASQPQVTPYQQIELDDGWREWENTKQELALVKRQLTEKDALVIQLKTASRRLQETLRKKDKDLQAAFAILRSPQDAKTTKTRKQELVDRLVSECMQRAATAEALAEERRRVLDRLRYSSKFLRFQELEAEIDECHTEIGRLRAKLETTASSPTIAGKLKVSSVPLAANGSAGLVKNTKLDPLNLVVDDSPVSRCSGSAPNNLAATRVYSSQSSAGQVRVVPLAKLNQREGFVSKTRRKALEAEYYKQVRLAQLEVECELEENLHIRAAREAKKLQAIEHNGKHVKFEIDSARSQQEEAADDTVEDNDPAISPSAEGVNVEAGHPDDAPREDPARVERQSDGESGITACTKEPSLEDKSNKAEQAGFDEKHEDDDPVSLQEVGVEEAHISSGLDNGEHTNRNIPVGNEENEHVQSKQKTYEDDEFDGSDDDVNSNSRETNPVHSAWNVDPNPQDNGNDPDDEPSTKVSSQDEIGTEQTIRNADPHAVAADTSMDDQVGFDNDDGHAAVAQQDDSVPNEENETNSAWNLDPSPSIPNPVDAPYVAEEPSGLEEDSKTIDETERRNAWNLDPTPPSEPAATSPAAEHADPHSDEEEQPVWNLNPNPVADVVVSPDIPAGDIDNTEEAHPEFVEDDEDEGSTSADASHIVDQHSSEITSVAEPTATNESKSSASNVDPNPPSSSPIPDDNVQDHEGSAEPVHSEGSSTPEVANADGDNGLAQAEANHHTGDSEVAQNNPWNMDPYGAATEPAGMSESTAANEGERESERTVWNLDPHAGTAADPENMPERAAANESQDEDERTVWNLDPHAGDASEPSDSVTEVTNAQESAPAPINAGLAVDQEQVESTSGNGTPTFADEEVDMAEVPDPTEHSSEPGSSQNSPRESAASSPAEDDTPDYTPPSTGRDSDAVADEEDATW